jgi:hypothetical protein
MWGERERRNSKLKLKHIFSFQKVLLCSLGSPGVSYVAHTGLKLTILYLGGRDQEDCSSRPVTANSSQDIISKIPNTHTHTHTHTKYTIQNRAGIMAQVVECLLSNHEVLSSNPMAQKKKIHK